MKVTFTYLAHIRKEAGTDAEEIALDDGASLADSIGTAAGRHGEGFQQLVTDEHGSVRPSLLALVNGRPAEPDRRLSAGDEVTLLSAVAGG